MVRLPLPIPKPNRPHPSNREFAMLRCGICFAALALASVVASPALADNVDDFMKQVDSVRYSPAEHGLKDVKVQVHNRTADQDFALSKAKVFVYWKSPDKYTANAEGLDPASAARLGPIIAGMKEYGKMIVPESMCIMREKFDYTISRERGKTVLIGVPKPGTIEAKAITRTKTWFDDRHLPVKVVNEGPCASWLEMTYVKKDGKFLLATTKGELDTGPMGMEAFAQTWTYTQIDGTWFPTKYKEVAMGGESETSFSGYEINQGLEDSLFGEEEDAK